MVLGQAAPADGQFGITTQSNTSNDESDQTPEPAYDQQTRLMFKAVFWAIGLYGLYRILSR